MVQRSANGNSRHARRGIAEIEAARRDIAEWAASTLRTASGRVTGPRLHNAVLTRCPSFLELNFLLLWLVSGNQASGSLLGRPNALANIRTFAMLAFAAAALVTGAYPGSNAARRTRYGLLLVAAGALVVATSGALGLIALGTVAMAVGAGSAASSQFSLVGVYAGALERPRALALHRAAATIGLAVPAVWLTIAPEHWRAEGVAVAALALASAVLVKAGGSEVDSPDVSAVRARVNDRAGAAADLREDPVRGVPALRLLAAAAPRLALVGQLWSGAVFGILLAYGGTLLARAHDATPSTSSIMLVVAVAAGAVLAAVAPTLPGSRLGPAAVVVSAAIVLAARGLAFPVTCIGLTVGFAGCWWLHVQLLGRVFAAVLPGVRAHLAGVSAAAWMSGAVCGITVDALVERRFGPGPAVLFAGPAVVLAARALVRTMKCLEADIDDVAAALVEDQQIRVLRAGGIARPLLACQHVDFSYGALQVLHDVSLDIEDGEMIALLGTNGAGKSTVLRVVSGLGRPDRGTVRLDGADITTLSPERRVRLGIVQVPGGRAVFPRLTVEENLIAYAYTLGVDRRRAEGRIAPVFERFPRLAERRMRHASTLSGGEAQMLGLAKAILLAPRLLIIDELSLGLAPKIVGELLELVRTINAAGTAVILVEQSLNVALSLVDRAYFMEKGQVRFEGAAADLLERGDLLRSVFLAGAERSLL